MRGQARRPGVSGLSRPRRAGQTLPLGITERVGPGPLSADSGPAARYVEMASWSSGGGIKVAMTVKSGVPGTEAVSMRRLELDTALVKSPLEAVPPEGVDSSRRPDPGAGTPSTEWRYRTTIERRPTSAQIGTSGSHNEPAVRDNVAHRAP